MKKLLCLAGILISLSCKAQVGFPNTDSLRKFTNKYINNTATEAFSNKRMNTLIQGMINWIDSARVGDGGSIGVDTLYAINDSTIRYKKNGNTYTSVFKGTYDARRKVDSMYRFNDSILIFTVNGTEHPLVFPGKDVRKLNDSTIKIGIDTVRFASSGSSRPFFFPRVYGALGNGTAIDRNPIQMALNAASAAGGGIVEIDNPGIYLVDTLTLDGVTRGLTMPANTSLWLAPGVTIKLKNSTLVNGKPVSIIYIPATATNVYIGWPFGKGGVVDGNTANQPGWTAIAQADGHRYGQSTGCFGIGAEQGFDGITIDGLTIQNTFSNSINLGGGNAYGLSKNVIIKNVTAQEFGEGIQMIGVDNVFVQNVTHIGDKAILNGDALELAFSRNIAISDCRSVSKDSSSMGVGGSGYDLYASHNVTVTNFYVQGWVYGNQSERDFNDSTNTPDDIVMSNIIMKDINFSPFIWTGGNISASNIMIRGNRFSGPQLSRGKGITPTNYRFDNYYQQGKGTFYIADSIKVSGTNMSFNYDSTIVSAFSVSDAELDINGLDIKGGSGAFLQVVDGKHPFGRITNVSANVASITGAPLITSGGSTIAVEKLIIEGKPALVATSGAPASIPGAGIAYITGTLTSANIPAGSKDQIAIITGTYAPVITPGARIKVLNNTAVTIPTASDRLALQYDATTDVWTEISRSFTSTDSRQNLQTTTDIGDTTNHVVSFKHVTPGEFSGYRAYNSLGKYFEVGYGNEGDPFGTTFRINHSSGHGVFIDSLGNIGSGIQPTTALHIFRSGSPAYITLATASADKAGVNYYVNGAFAGVEEFDENNNRYLYHASSNTFPYFFFANGRMKFGGVNSIEDGSGAKVQVDGTMHVTDRISTDSISGYTGAFSLASLGNNDWITKQNLVDALAGAGSNTNFDPVLLPGDGTVGNEIHPDTTAWIATKYDVSIIHTQLDSLINNLVIGGGGGLSVVSHDATLINNGTPGSHLGVDTTTTVATKYDLTQLPGIVPQDPVSAGAGISVAGGSGSPYVVSATGSAGTNPGQWISVKDYGAVADAVVTGTNDTATGTDLAPYLNSAIAAADGGNGQVVVIPSGKWVLHSAVDTIRNKRLMLVIYGTVYCNKRTFIKLYPPTGSLDRKVNDIFQYQHNIWNYGHLIGAANLPSHGRANYDAHTAPNWAAMTGSPFEVFNMYGVHIYSNKVSGFKNGIDIISSVNGTAAAGGQQNTYTFQEIDRCANGINMRSLNGDSYQDKWAFTGPDGGEGHIDAGLGIKIDGYSGTASNGETYNGQFNSPVFQNILLERVDSAIQMLADVVEPYFNHVTIEAGSSKGVFGSQVFNLKNTAPNYVRNSTWIGGSYWYTNWFINAKLGIRGEIISTPIFTSVGATPIGNNASLDASGNVIIQIDPAVSQATLNGLPANCKFVAKVIAPAEDVTITTSTYTVPTGVRTVKYNYTGGLVTIPSAASNVKRTISITNIATGNETISGLTYGNNIIAAGSTANIYSDGTYWTRMDDGNGATVGSNKLNALSIVDFGGVPNISTTAQKTANVTAFVNMVAAAADGQMCIIPDGDYYFNNNLIASSSSKKFYIYQIGDLRFDAGRGVVIEGVGHNWKATGNCIGGNTGATDSASFSHYLGNGYYLKNCNNCNLWVNTVTGFYSGVMVAGESTTTPKGSQYCNIYYQWIKDNYIQLYNTTHGTTDGSAPSDLGNWSNSNMYYGGQLGAPGGGTHGTFGILQQKGPTSSQHGANRFNYNHYFTTGIEGCYWGVWMNFSELCYIGPGRWEGLQITHKIFLQEDNGSGLACFNMDLSDMQGVYESYFEAGGKGLSTSFPKKMLNANFTPTGDAFFPDATGGAIALVGKEPSTRLSVFNMLSLSNMGGGVNDQRYGFHKILGSTNDYISLDGKSTTQTGNYTITSTISTVYCNPSGSQTITLPAASSYLDGRVIWVKNKSTTLNVTVSGPATGNTTTLLPGQGAGYKSDGTNWYNVAQDGGSASVNGTTVTTSASVYTVGATEGMILCTDPTAGTQQVNLPTASTYPNRIITICSRATGKAISIAGGDPIGSNTTGTTPSSITYRSSGTDWIIISRAN